MLSLIVSFSLRSSDVLKSLNKFLTSSSSCPPIPHDSMEDIAILRALPNMTVFCPSGPKETRDGLLAALDYDAPIYIRLGKKGEPDLYEGPETIEFGKAVTMCAGTDACIIGSGPVLNQAMLAAKTLKFLSLSGLYKAIGFEKRNKLYPQLSDHYFTGEYPVKPTDLLEGGEVTQLSLLSTKSNN